MNPQGNTVNVPIQFAESEQKLWRQVDPLGLFFFFISYFLIFILLGFLDVDFIDELHSVNELQHHQQKNHSYPFEDSGDRVGRLLAVLVSFVNMSALWAALRFSIFA